MTLTAPKIGKGGEKMVRWGGYGWDRFLQTTPAPPLKKEGRSYIAGNESENERGNESGG